MRKSRVRAHILSLASFILFFAAFFGPTLSTGKFLVAGDAFYQTYPLRMIAWDAIQSGELPLWTPLIFSGYPLLSMAQVAIGYPLTWGYLLLPGHWAEQVIVLAPFLLTPMFTYAYTRQLGRSHLAAVLAGLAFTYGGNISSKLGGLSPMVNAEMWLPLFLLAIERARRGAFASCLLGATGAYTMTVLAGHAQASLLVGMVALAYAAFISSFLPVNHGAGVHVRWWQRWQPFGVAAGAVMLACGVGAYQILETLQVLRRSVRTSLNFEVFSAGAFTLAEALWSFIAPLYHHIEVSTYVAPLTALLALYGATQVSRTTADRRVLFWLSMAVAAFVLMLGANTPLYKLLHQVPVFNLFRYPSRHALEWTFALSILAAYGWDGLYDTVRRARGEAKSSKLKSIASWIFLGMALALGLLWWRYTVARPRMPNFGLDSGLIPSASEHSYLLWKLAFTTVLVLVIWLAIRIAATWGRGMLVCALVLAHYVEPHILLSHVWFPFAKTTDQFTVAPPVSTWLQQHVLDQERIYTRVNLFVHGYWQPPAVDLPNMTAVRGLENVAGYEQLILERYSRALGNVGPDAVNLRYGVKGPPDGTLFTGNSHVLDVLNTRFVVGFSHLATVPEPSIDKEGIRFAASELAHSLRPGETVNLVGEGGMGDTLAIVTSLASSVEVEQGTPVARLKVIEIDGQTFDGELRAGLDTAEWAYERADVRAVVKHQRAPIFDNQPGDSFPAHRYLARLPLGGHRRVARVEITNVAEEAQLALWKATIHDSTQDHSVTLKIAAAVPVGKHWNVESNIDGVVVWENQRVLPRVWLVAEVEAVDGEEALQHLRGVSGREFDPRRTALLELPAAELPVLPGGHIAPESSARVVTYSANRLTVETSAPTPTVLVLSEIFYPGWEARVDGELAPILLTNYLLRGVALPAGQHKVEMRYTAPAARKGAVISLLALLFLGGLSLYARRSSKRAARFEVL